MPSQKSELYIKIRIFEKEFTLNGKLMHDKTWKIKKGRSPVGYITTTEIMKKCLHFISENVKSYKANQYNSMVEYKDEANYSRRT